jgi:hypothetical protein
MTTPNSTDRVCSGCDQPSYDVGPLTICRITFRRGGSATVSYCHDCRELAEASTSAPGQSDGARALSMHIKSVVRLPFSRVTRGAAMPRTMHESDIPAEYEDGNARVLAEMDFGNPFLAFSRSAS